MTDIEAKGILGQIKLLKKPLNTLKQSRYGRTVGLIGLGVFLGIFIVVSILGGILAGIAALLAIIATLIYVIYPYVKIETINPASRGIAKLLGRRVKDYTLDEGATIVIKGVPFIGGIFEFEAVHVGTVDIDFTGVVIFDKDNFDLSVSGAFSIEADSDPKKLNEFYDRGGAHGIDDNGETKREVEGIHGIVDLLLGMIKSALLKEAGELDYSGIIKSRADLENEALKKITMDPNADVNALNPDKPYCIPGMGANILTFVISGIEPGSDLKKILTKQGIEKTERVYRKFDAETKKILAQEMLGMTDEEFEEYRKDNPEKLEDIYLILTALEREEELLAEGLDVKPGDAVLKIRLARLLNKDINIGNILDLFGKLKGGK